MFIFFLSGNNDKTNKKSSKIRGGITRMPNNQHKHSRNKNTNNESVNEAGRNGKEATSNNQKYEFYEKLGRKGEEVPTKLTDFDKDNHEETDGQNEKRNDDDYNSINS